MLPSNSISSCSDESSTLNFCTYSISWSLLRDEAKKWTSQISVKELPLKYEINLQILLFVCSFIQICKSSEWTTPVCLFKCKKALHNPVYLFTGSFSRERLCGIESSTYWTSCCWLLRLWSAITCRQIPYIYCISNASRWVIGLRRILQNVLPHKLSVMCTVKHTKAGNSWSEIFRLSYAKHLLILSHRQNWQTIVKIHEQINWHVPI
jgi:hypothetical protein